MKLLFLLLLSVSFATLATAQIQFWNLNDIEDAPQILMRKQNKVKQVLVYRTDERMSVRDSTDIEEIRDYNVNGQLIAKTRFKYDWGAKKRYVLAVDSVFYSNEGKFQQYKTFEGPNYNRTYDYIAKYDKAGFLQKIEIYNVTNFDRRLESHTIYSWSSTKKVSGIKEYAVDRKLSNTWSFTYDATGRLIKESSKMPDGFAGYIHKLSWGKTSQLIKYEELSGTSVEKTLNYFYDDLGRLIKKKTESSNYNDFTDYHYAGNSKLIMATYLQYPGYSNKADDRRHEYRVFIYQFY